MQFIQIFKNLGIIVLGIIWIIWRILSERMSSYRAKFIANNFEIVAALEKSNLYQNGFTAAVWKGKGGTSYEGKLFRK